MYLENGANGWSTSAIKLPKDASKAKSPMAFFDLAFKILSIINTILPDLFILLEYYNHLKTYYVKLNLQHFYSGSSHKAYLKNKKKKKY